MCSYSHPNNLYFNCSPTVLAGLLNILHLFFVHEQSSGAELKGLCFLKCLWVYFRPVYQPQCSGFTLSIISQYLTMSVNISCSQSVYILVVAFLLTPLTQRPVREICICKGRGHRQTYIYYYIKFVLTHYQYLWLFWPYYVVWLVWSVIKWNLGLFWCPSSFQRDDSSGKLMLLQTLFVSGTVELLVLV